MSSIQINSRSLIKYIIYFIAVIFVIAGIKGARMYSKIYGPNIIIKNKQPVYITIPSGSNYEDVLNILYSRNLVKNKKTFEWAVDKKNYRDHIHPGRYHIHNNMSNNELVNMLRSGLQEPVEMIINNEKNLPELAQKIASQLEPDSFKLMQLFNDEQFLGKYGFNKYTVLGMFIPNTYEFWWNTTPESLFKRMYKEYDKFWTYDRRYKAEKEKLTQNQVITLASIVYNETSKVDEYRRIAGVYINRLDKGIKLQADPTVKYLLGNDDRQRVLKNDTYIDSPYNTYLHYGLPPGPITIPSIGAIDAVLDYEKHDYLYFCAKEDFSGYHNFARTLEQHNKNARLYQKALNHRRILN